MEPVFDFAEQSERPLLANPTEVVSSGRLELSAEGSITPRSDTSCTPQPPRKPRRTESPALPQKESPTLPALSRQPSSSTSDLTKYDPAPPWEPRPTSIFPPTSRRPSSSAPDAVGRPLQYSPFGTLPSSSSESEDEESGEEETVILAGRNLICIPTPNRNVNNVRLVDLSYNSLKMLNGVHVYSKLRELVLDNNRLTQLCLPPMNHLASISVNNNNLKELPRILNNLEISVPGLTYLSMLFNPICPNELMSGDEEDYQMYRNSILNRLKSLKFLDSRPVRMSERVAADRFVFLAEVARPSANNYHVPSTVPYGGNPLRASKPLKPTHKRTSVAGKVSKHYVGRNSEGNRFISNDLL